MEALSYYAPFSFWQTSRHIPASGSIRTECRPGEWLAVGGAFPGIGLQSPFKIESLSIFDKRPNINDNTLVNRLWWSWRWAFLGNPYWNTAHLSESDRPWARSSQGILWNANGEIGVCVFSPSCRSLHRSEEYQCFMAFLQVVCLLLDMQFGPSLEGAFLLAVLMRCRPFVWRRGSVSPESANFPFFSSSVLPSGDWKSHFSSSVATVTIFCDFSYCYPVPCPGEAPMLLALWRLLSGSYFLSFCENVVRLELCSKCVGSVLYVFFSFNFPSFSIFRFCLGCPWLELSSVWVSPLLYSAGLYLTHILMMADRDSGKQRWVSEGIDMVVRCYSRPPRILASIRIRYYC